MALLRIVGLAVGMFAAWGTAGCGDDFESSTSDSTDGGELTGGSRECAEAYQAMKACERAACDASCPSTGQAALEERRQCYLDALDGPCAPHTVSGACATLAGPINACLGTGFDDQFIAAGNALCVSGWRADSC